MLAGIGPSIPTIPTLREEAISQSEFWSPLQRTLVSIQSRAHSTEEESEVQSKTIVIDTCRAGMCLKEQ